MGSVIAEGDRVTALEVLEGLDLGNQAAEIVEAALACRPE